MKHNARSVPSRGGARFLIAVLGAFLWAAAGAAAHAAPAIALHVVTAPAPPGSRPNNAKHKQIVSPYARAAAAQAHAGRASGHAPTLMQGVGLPHRAHPAGRSN